MKKQTKKWLASLALASFAAVSASAQLEVDADLPAYEKTEGVGGSLDSIGSDTLNNLMALWAETFRKAYPNVEIQVEGKGSSTAPPALTEGTAQLGPMSRAMKDSELEQFEDKFGYKPTKVGVALDSLAVFVNKDSTIDELAMEQVDAIFSKTRKGGFEEDITNWSQLGLTNAPISLYGRNSASGTYGYFKKKALFKGDYKDSVKEQPGSASVVQGISEDINGVGYSGIGYLTSGVKTVALSKGDGDFYEASYENVLSGKYPLGRMLYVYINKAPGKELDKTIKEFLKLVLSKEGQEIVVKDGYLPLTAALAEQQLKVLE